MTTEKGLNEEKEEKEKEHRATELQVNVRGELLEASAAVVPCAGSEKEEEEEEERVQFTPLGLELMQSHKWSRSLPKSRSVTMAKIQSTIVGEKILSCMSTQCTVMLSLR